VTDWALEDTLSPSLRELAGASIRDALERAVHAWPHAPAIHFVDADLNLTFAELGEAVAETQELLAASGLRAGESVALVMENGPAFPIAWLAIVNSGCVAVPVNPRSTPREAEYVLSDADVSMILVQEDLRHLGFDQTRQTPRTVISFPSNHWRSAQPVESARPRTSSLVDERPSKDTVATIQFTSGTTGLPKGCLLTHEYWLLLGCSCTAMAVEPTNILGDHPFYYMQNQVYLATALVSGAQLHVTHGLSRSRFLGWLHEMDIDFAWVGDSLLELPPSPLDRAHRLRFAPCDGIRPERHRALEERFGLVVREWYGSTEIGIGIHDAWDDDAAVGTGSMGFCSPMRESLIVDDDLQPVEPGRVGELCIRGPGIMLGYHNRPDANTEVFFGDGWFRTGDLCIRDASGRHFFQGRIKDIIRRSGENISAAEVEQQIGGHPAVLDVAVVAVPDAARDEEAMAFVVLRPDQPAISEAELRFWCSDRLASFKIPRYFVFRPELPLTNSGKIHKAELHTAGVAILAGLADDARHQAATAGGPTNPSASSTQPSAVRT
jgi:acyl-CoA synthetase (AMP-forming)/AMP-acid ligase II